MSQEEESSQPTFPTKEEIAARKSGANEDNESSESLESSESSGSLNLEENIQLQVGGADEDSDFEDDESAPQIPDRQSSSESDSEVDGSESDDGASLEYERDLPSDEEGSLSGEDDDEEDEEDDEEGPKTPDGPPPSVTQQQQQISFGSDTDTDEEEEDEAYLQKLDKDMSRDFIVDFHPESQTHNYDEVRKLSKVARNAEGRVIDALHRTNPFLTKYEYTRVLGQRAKQIDAGAVAFVKTPPEILDGYLIAKAELEAKKLPFIIRRPLPGGGFEYWHLEDLELLR